MGISSSADLLATRAPHHSYPRECLIQECIREIQDHFKAHFDQNWLLLILEDLPIEASIMNDIRSLAEYERPATYDPWEIQRRIPSLDGFIAHLRRYLLPMLREKLGISGLLGRSYLGNREQRLLRGLIACAFPTNLEKLAQLSSRLKSLLCH